MYWETNEGRGGGEVGRGKIGSRGGESWGGGSGEVGRGKYGGGEWGKGRVGEKGVERWGGESLGDVSGGRRELRKREWRGGKGEVWGK